MKLSVILFAAALCFDNFYMNCSRESQDQALDLLYDEAKRGIAPSALAYRAYLDFMIGKRGSYFVGEKETCVKIVSVGLGKHRAGGVDFEEYFVSDELPALQRTECFYGRIGNGKKGN